MVVDARTYEVRCKGGVHASPIGKEHAVQTDEVEGGIGQELGRVAERVHFSVHGFDHPQRAPVVHEVLVEQPTVEVVEGVAGLGHHDSVKAVQAANLHAERGLTGGAVHREFAEIESVDVVALAQAEFERCGVHGLELAVSFEECHALTFCLKKAAQGGREGILQILNAGVDLGVWSLCELLKEQRNRPLALAVADYGARKHLLGFDAVGLLNFELNGAEAQVLELGVGVAAHLRIRILRRID